MKIRFAVLSAVLLVATSGALAQTATSDVDVTFSAANSMTMSAGSSVSLTPTVGGGVATDSSTTLDYSTNDGGTHVIELSVALGGWTFVPAVAGSTTSEYPVLTFQSSAVTGGGTANTTQATLISSASVEGSAVNVVTGIANTSGSVAVTLGASITQNVTAGGYTTTLTYTFK